MSFAEYSYRARHLRYLADPQTGAPLVSVDGGLGLAGQAEAIYQVSPSGLLKLFLGEAVSERSAAYDADCQRQGWRAPDEAAFKQLPQTGLSGWGLQYWRQRALSTAAVWDFLERRRLSAKRLPIGAQGVALDLTSGLPYLAHGLDAGGFVTYVASPHAGRYGLEAYPYSRYCRVQTDWVRLPFQPACFDVVVVSGALALIAPNEQGEFLRQAARLIKTDGALLITDSPNYEAHQATLEALGLRVKQRALYDDSLRPTTRVIKMLRSAKSEFPPMLIAV